MWGILSGPFLARQAGLKDAFKKFGNPKEDGFQIEGYACAYGGVG